MTIRPRSRTGAKTAERGPTQTLASPLRRRLPLVVALPGGEGRVQDREAVAEAGAEAGHRLRGEADLGDEDDRTLAALQRRLDRGQVDLGLARAGDAVEEQLARGAGLAVERGDDPRHRLAPARAVAAGESAAAERPDSAGARRRAALRVATRPRRSSRRSVWRSEPIAVASSPGRHLAGAQRFEHGALLGAEPLAAAEGGLAGGEDLGAKLGLGAGRAAAAAGPGPRRQHQLQPARGRRAVLAGDPEAEPHQLRRRSRLQRLDRLGEALGRQLGGLGELDHDPEQPPRPEGNPDDAADADGPPSPPAGGSRRGRAGRARWSGARPGESSPVEVMGGGGWPGLLPGEVICWPAWASTSTPASG